MQPRHQQQQEHGGTIGGDASADKEVMSILSSPVQQKKFVVKPQPRPGGVVAPASAVAAAAGALGPASPGANGSAFAPQPSAVAALGGGDYHHRDAVASASGGRGGGGAVDTGLRVGRGIGAADPSSHTGLTAGPGLSPPRKTPGLPKSTSASWDPQVQSSSSAFSVPMGRGGGGGGIGSLSLGGFRPLGGGDRFKVREGYQ